jgi:surfeit locus 1 family protein
VRLGGFEFRPPGLPVSLLTLLLLVLLLGLGCWQLDRAAQKRQLLAQYQGQHRETALQVPADLTASAALEYRAAQVQGRYDTAHQFLLDNRTRQGMAGYEVLTPLRMPGGTAAILVNRGWVPLGSSRTQLPELDLPDAAVRIEGLLKRPARPFTLGEGEDREPGWPKVLQQVRLDLQAEQLGYPLLPMLLLLGPEQAHGYVREWRPLPGFGPERNVGYAVQWFALAAALVLIYFFVNSRRAGYDDEQ